MVAMTKMTRRRCGYIFVMWGWQGPFKSRFKKENDNPASIKGKMDGFACRKCDIHAWKKNH